MWSSSVKQWQTWKQFQNAHVEKNIHRWQTSSEHYDIAERYLLHKLVLQQSFCACWQNPSNNKFGSQMTLKMTTEAVFSNLKELLKSEWNSFGVGLTQACCQGSVITDISFCTHLQFCFAKQSCAEQFIMKMHVLWWNKRLIALFPFLRDNSKWNCFSYQRARIFIKRDYFFATIGKLHTDFLDVSKPLEITLCWWLKLCQWVELISTRFRIILICFWSDLQKVNTAFHSETNKKTCKPQFTQIVLAIDFAKAGFHLLLNFPSRIYSWCYVEKFHDPEGLFEIQTIICTTFSVPCLEGYETQQLEYHVTVGAQISNS